MVFNATDDRAVVTARLLAMDSVENAKSGHPGTAIALAPVAHLLFQKHLRHDPATPDWPGRDRFVLSCGHASMLLYTQLFLTGYGLEIEDLQSFRTLDSNTPGHPEYGHTAGVETTTGPLGQGLATAVGMAMGLKHERALYDAAAAPGESPFDRTVFVLASDGDLQEGLSHEAGALAGRHQLDNLVVIYDDNGIQIEGGTSLTQDEDVEARFAAQRWFTQRVGLATDGDIDVVELDAALAAARTQTGRPSIIVLKSQIAWPAPNAMNTAASHGAPLGAVEVSATRGVLGVAATEPFEVSADVLEHTRAAIARGAVQRSEWVAGYKAWAQRSPEGAVAWERASQRELPDDLFELLPMFEPGDALATRDASGKVIQALAARLPELWGGSADLAEPNRTEIKGGRSFLPEETETSGRGGRNIHWGVREGAMAAAMNGIALASSPRIFAGTFLIFSDYQRPAIRLAALMKLPVIYIWSHDSVALGADGPTHQPIEHLASLRAMPGLAVVRPADAEETVAAWAAALHAEGPVGLVLARQAVAVATTPRKQVREGVRRGAYVVRDSSRVEAIIVATGSELALALDAVNAPELQGLGIRVISMPSREWFAAQEKAYRQHVLPDEVRARVVVEAASPFGWSDIAGEDGLIVGIDEFGLSAPADQALAARGMTSRRVIDAVLAVTQSVAVA